jgi:hypothetical protein
MVRHKYWVGPMWVSKARNVSKLSKCFWFATEIVVDANGLSVFDLLRYQRDGHRRAVRRRAFVMPTFLGAAGLIPRPRAQARPA